MVSNKVRCKSKQNQIRKTNFSKYEKVDLATLNFENCVATDTVLYFQLGVTYEVEARF